MFQAKRLIRSRPMMSTFRADLSLQSRQFVAAALFLVFHVKVGMSRFQKAGVEAYSLLSTELVFAGWY